MTNNQPIKEGIPTEYDSIKTAKPTEAVNQVLKLCSQDTSKNSMAILALD